ncbi:MAG: pyridoxamine 5'-phosphate oxidase family protein [Deltaproteobacteria bacterium]|nr:pyridoxamine 5'-phosphate oxidase family protein [Deltaproteobacteria bacterium]MBW2448394.1 pyridoxamine 5'-phosphate oxidase family protein [Deltaproteobacteria bacterium]
MGKEYERFEPALVRFIGNQHVFFVATAPTGDEGWLNLSPKGLDSLRVLDDRTLAYLDFTGSGVETIAHLRENGRIIVCFCALEGPPKILRVQGRGDVFEPDDPEFADLRANFPDAPLEAAVRAIVRVRAERIRDACGYAVPLYEFQGERSQLHDWADRKGEAGMVDYRRENNARSLDGLPGLRGSSSQRGS